MPPYVKYVKEARDTKTAMVPFQVIVACILTSNIPLEHLPSAVDTLLFLLPDEAPDVMTLIPSSDIKVEHRMFTRLYFVLFALDDIVHDHGAMFEPILHRSWEKLFKWYGCTLLADVEGPMKGQQGKPLVDIIAKSFCTIIRVMRIEVGSPIFENSATIAVPARLLVAQNLQKIDVEDTFGVDLACLEVLTGAGYFVWSAVTEEFIRTCGGPDVVADMIEARLEFSMKDKAPPYAATAIEVDLAIHLLSYGSKTLRSCFRQREQRLLRLLTEGLARAVAQLGPQTFVDNQQLLRSIVNFFEQFPPTYSEQWIVPSLRFGYLNIIVSCAPIMDRFPEDFIGFRKVIQSNMDCVLDKLTMLKLRSTVEAAIVGFSKIAPAHLESALVKGPKKIRDSIANLKTVIFRCVVYRDFQAPGSKLSFDLTRCATCQVPSGDSMRHFQTCSGCRLVAYCSKPRQNVGWIRDGHKSQCKVFRKRTEPKPTTQIVKQTDMAYIETAARYEVRRRLPALPAYSADLYPGVPFHPDHIVVVVHFTKFPPIVGTFPIDDKHRSLMSKVRRSRSGGDNGGSPISANAYDFPIAIEYSENKESKMHNCFLPSGAPSSFNCAIPPPKDGVSTDIQAIRNGSDRIGTHQDELVALRDEIDVLYTLSMKKAKAVERHPWDVVQDVVNDLRSGSIVTPCWPLQDGGVIF